MASSLCINSQFQKQQVSSFLNFATDSNLLTSQSMQTFQDFVFPQSLRCVSWKNTTEPKLWEEPREAKQQYVGRTAWTQLQKG